MSVSPKLSMHISFQDFEFSEEAIYPKSDVACAIFLNENCIDKLYLNNDSAGKFSLTNPDDRLRFIFRSKQTGAIIGCISFLLKAFYTNIDKQFTQWLTLFDCPEDDEFDGNLGEDDEETPRVLFQYQIFSDNVGSDNENTPKKQQFLRTEVSDIQHKFNSNMSYVSGMTEFGSPIKMEPHLYSDAKNSEVEEIMIASVAPQFQYSFHHHHEEFSKENNSYFETKETPRLEPKIDPVIENKGIFRLEQPLNEAEIEPLDLQIDSLQAINEKNSERSEPNQEPVQVRLETNDEGEYLLYLENERNTKLQEILKLTESRLVHVEAAYKDLDIKSKFQIQGLVDKNRVLNQDNQNLREKVQELEENLDKVSEPAEAYSDKYSRQLDLAAVEDHRAKNQTLEKLNLSLKEELERIKRICHQEKQLNQNLQAQLEIISNQYKQDILVIKEENNGYVEQLNQMSEELFTCREKYSRLELEVTSIGTIKESLERELQIKSKAIVSLKKEAQDYQELTEDLRKTIREFKANSEREIAVLRQDIAVLEDKIRDQDKSNKEANEYIREMQREIECFQAKGYEEKVNMLTKEVESCEITIKDLKEIVENCKCGVLNENMKAQSETESDRDKRAKLLEKFQTLTYQYQEQMVKMQTVRKENFELSTRVEELEREKEQYSHFLDQVKPLQDENEHLWSLLSRMKNHLALNAAELVNQAGRVSTQKAVIKNLNEKLQPSDDTKTVRSQLSQMEQKPTKNEEFKRSYVVDKANGLNRAKNIEAQAQKANSQSTSRSVVQSKQDEESKEDREGIEKTKGTKQISTGPSSQESSRIENSSKLKSSEIDQKLKELMKKTKILMKFVRIGEGVYVFGSKRVQVRSIDGKLVIKIKGGYIFIEEFIRLYTHEELTKLKTMKGEISYTNIEDENLHSDVDKAHIISDNNAITDQDSFRANNGNINGSLSLQCSPIKEEVSGKKMLAEGMRPASLSYRGNEPSWPVKKEIDSSREAAGTVNRNKARQGHTKGAPSVEFSPRFQQHEDDVRKWASNNYSEQKSFRENNNGKKK